VHGTLDAGRFPFLERTLIESLQRIAQKLLAFGTEFFTLVMSVAVHIDHHPEGLAFSGHSMLHISLYQVRYPVPEKVNEEVNVIDASLVDVVGLKTPVGKYDGEHQRDYSPGECLAGG
jgi:hypothetical protein